MKTQSRPDIQDVGHPGNVSPYHDEEFSRDHADAWFAVQGNITVCWLKDPITGEPLGGGAAKRNPDDQFVYRIGQEIAFREAMKNAGFTKDPSKEDLTI